MGNVHSIDKLEDKSIFWRRHPEINRYFFMKEEDKIILLRLNNFPDEPLLTVINGMKIYDLEERPKNWELEE